MIPWLKYVLHEVIHGKLLDENSGQLDPIVAIVRGRLWEAEFYLGSVVYIYIGDRNDIVYAWKRGSEVRGTIDQTN